MSNGKGDDRLHARTQLPYDEMERRWQQTFQRTPITNEPVPTHRHMTQTAKVLLAEEREQAKRTIRENHYTKSVPSGKSHYVAFGDALVVWSIPANKNIAKYILGWDGNVWELSRLWAPDGHEKNLLTQAIAYAVKQIVRLENPDAIVSYADPNVGHKGGVYRAASWVYDGVSEESRVYVSPDGTFVSRRAFHSGSTGLKKAEILALGFTEKKLPGKQRFFRLLSRKAKAKFGERNVTHLTRPTR